MTSVDQRERERLSEGFALGLAPNGRWEIPYNALRIDVAFLAALRKWPSLGAFPQVLADVRGNHSGLHILTRADEMSSADTFFWGPRSGSVLTINRRRVAWDAESPQDVSAAVKAIGDNVDRHGWAQVGGEFLSELPT